MNSSIICNIWLVYRFSRGAKPLQTYIMQKSSFLDPRPKWATPEVDPTERNETIGLARGADTECFGPFRAQPKIAGSKRPRQRHRDSVIGIPFDMRRGAFGVSPTNRIDNRQQSRYEI